MDVAEVVPAASVTETKLSDSIESTLREILSTIQKPALDPPLTISDIEPEKIERIKPASTADDFYKTSLETAHKSILYDIAVSLRHVHLPSHTCLYLPHRSGIIRTTRRPMLPSPTSWICP
jgi:hypothetical protein